MKRPLPEDKEYGLETAISYILVIGVIISFLLEISGIILFYIHNGNLSISQNSRSFIEGSNFFGFIINKMSLSHSGNISIFLMTWGLVILMLTPFVRVLMSVIFFGKMKNLKYVWITLFVLVVLTVSLTLH